MRLAIFVSAQRMAVYRSCNQPLYFRLIFNGKNDVKNNTGMRVGKTPKVLVCHLQYKVCHLLLTVLQASIINFQLITTVLRFLCQLKDPFTTGRDIVTTKQSMLFDTQAIFGWLTAAPQQGFYSKNTQKIMHIILDDKSQQDFYRKITQKIMHIISFENNTFSTVHAYR